MDGSELHPRGQNIDRLSGLHVSSMPRPSHKPGWLNGRRESLSLSLPLVIEVYQIWASRILSELKVQAVPRFDLSTSVLTCFGSSSCCYVLSSCTCRVSCMSGTAPAIPS